MERTSNARSRLHEALGELVAAKSRETRLCVAADHAYLYVVRTQESDGLVLHAPATHHLAGDHKLSQRGAQWLRTNGFSRPGGRRDFCRVLEHPPRPEDLARECAQILAQAYGVELATPTLRLEHDDRAHPSNDEVKDAMRTLAASRSHEDRLVLYNALVNATLLVPVDPEADDAADGPEVWINLDPSSDTPVFGVCTDWAQLRMWSLHASEYIPTPGAEFFEEFMETPSASLRINPEGSVGGELYRHEIEMIVKGIRRWHKKHAH